jgi:hypothetical protein
MSGEQWAVVPDIRYWRGDLRRDWSPYVLTGGISGSCLNVAQWAAGMLRKRGIDCYVEMIAADGRSV